MKRLMTLACAIMMGGLFAGVFADEYFTDDNDIRYRILSESEKTCEVAGYESGASNDISFPKEVKKSGKTYTVKGIGKYAFQYNSTITYISIPAGLEYIDDGAFMGCSSLQKAQLEANSVKRLGSYAFTGCTAMTSVGMTFSDNMLPTGLNIIDDFCFLNCTSLKTIGIPKTCYRIGKEGVFLNCVAMESFTTEEDGYFFVEDRALYSNNNQLVCYPAKPERYTVNILDGTVEIFPYAFSHANCAKISIPESVYIIGEYAFDDCAYLHSMYVEWEGQSLQDLQVTAPLFGGEEQRDFKLHIPIGTTSQYSAKSPWNTKAMEEYDVKIRDFKINNEDVFRTTLNNYVSSGTMTFDAVSRQLTMRNCTLTKNITFMGENTVELYLYGQNTIRKSGEDDYALTVGYNTELLVDGYEDPNSKLTIDGRVNISYGPAILSFSYLNLVVQGDPEGNRHAIGTSYMSSYLYFNNCNAVIKGNDKASTILQCNITLTDCGIVKPTGGYVYSGDVKNADGSVCKGDIEIEAGETTTYDLTVGGTHVTSKNFPFLESGEAWIDDDEYLHLKNAVIRTNKDGINSPNSLHIYLEGNNYIYSQRNGMYLSDDVFVMNEPGTSDGRLTIESDSYYGIYTEGVLDVYDVTLDVYGGYGALSGCPYTNSAGNEIYYGALYTSEGDITLRCTSDYKPVVSFGNIDLGDDADFIYDNYKFDPDQHTVVCDNGDKVTRTIRIVPKNKIQNYDIWLGGSHINNYNAADFAPMTLQSGSVKFEKFGSNSYLYLDNAVFDDSNDEYAFESTEKNIDIYVKGKCKLPTQGYGWLFMGKTLTGPDNSCTAHIRGDYTDGSPEIEMDGGFYIRGEEGASSLTISDMTIKMINWAYTWSEDDCYLIVENSTLDMYNTSWPDQPIIEYINVELYNCAYEVDGTRYDDEQNCVVDRNGNPVKKHLKIVAGKEASPTAITVPVCQAVSLPESPAYNLQGQRVGEGYRGIIITNGKKSLIQK